MGLRSYTIRTTLIRMHLADYTSLEGSNGKQWSMCCKAALHTVDKCHKFRGRNSLRGEGCNNPTLTHTYLFKLSLFYFINHVYSCTLSCLLTKSLMVIYLTKSCLVNSITLNLFN